ncbi:hypothetical protein [Acinetobacter rudis]|uniref:Uncharacterized protein n=1 Tax=Acinetobacter rudis CIP 110305 TaxID=421052 RepID=S3NJC9_9GAMM|nr:hypothetical protein [Acinetobacter rudis]EPF79742.1 hypothetical protein F945_00630 [Acinetobacter rudis CIP 110305]
MKFIVFLFGLLLSGWVSAQPVVKFDHTGIQKGAYVETCYHNPCSVAKVQSFKQLKQTNTQSNIELTLIGGSKAWDSKKIDWDKQPHKVKVYCSITHPIVQIDRQKTLLPINEGFGVPGILMVDAELYLQACHNFHSSVQKAAEIYGYDVHDEE